MYKFLFCNKFIIFLYMFRALLCSSSGSQNCIIQHLVYQCSKHVEEYNKLFIKEEFVHYVGQLVRLY